MEKSRNWRLQVQIRNDQKIKKVEIYERVINLLFHIMVQAKLEKCELTEPETHLRFSELVTDLTLWASDDVLKCYMELSVIGAGANV